MVKVAVIASILLIAGCGTTVGKKEQIIPPSELSMKDVYDRHGTGASGAHQTAKLVVSRPANGAELSLDAYQQNRLNERPTFRKLPNPTIYIYFAPTLSKDGRMPIPAWMTEFQMYDKDEYALPGELNLGDRQ
ncbi:hypothetical protein [Vibrio sp. 1180_3]|uniref:hypothetical protein n=1 Tax=Vibrio sp. 1180_3 TaxID=2528832 RepID=UPI002406E8D3|nr:hypothetical protein [Vibrio sp. 1180_3]MDF9399125.1 hypothetical protein [Vibrio sp. 1180_3]